MKKKLQKIMVSLITMCLMLAMMPHTALATSAFELPFTEEEALTFPEQVGVLLNEFRMENGLEPVEMVPILQNASSVRAQELTEYYSHARLDGSDWFTVIEENPELDSNCYAAENIAAGFDTPEAVMEAWKNSPSHRAAMLGENYQYVGIGFASLEDDPNCYYTFWQMLLISAETAPAGAWMPGQKPQTMIDEFPVDNGMGTHDEVLTGDMNLDGILTIADAVLLEQLALDKIEGSEYTMKQADCFCDGVIDQNDAMVLMQYVLQKISQLPVNV